MKPSRLLAASLATIVLPATLWATPVPVSNFSFESPVVGANNFNTTGTVSPAGDAAITSWGAQVSGGGNAGVQDPTPKPAGQDGVQQAYINGAGDIYQDVGVLQPNTTYTLVLAIGTNPGYTGQTGAFALLNGTDGTGATLQTSGPIDISTVTTTAMTDYSISYTSPSVVSGDLTVDLENLSSNGRQVTFDNVRLDAVTSVPEPSTWLDAAGLLLLVTAGGFRRRLRS